MLALLFAAVLSAAPSQTAVQPTPQGAAEVSPVIVTARNHQAALRALEACIQRGCPPDEEMRLALKSAEASFLAGEYHQARATLDRTIRRNKRHGKAHPVLLAGVYKADNTINRHLGRGDEAQKSARQASLLLGQRYGETSPAALWARLEAADALLNGSRRHEARARYRELEAEARAAGLSSLAGLAALRQAALPALAGRLDKSRKRLDTVVEAADPGGGLALAARLMQVKLLPEQAQDAAAAEAIAAFRPGASLGSEPLLLWAPPLNQDGERLLVEALAAAGIAGPYVPDPSDWIDVSYAIDASGRVKAAEIVRAGSRSAPWHETALSLFKRRLYAPGTAAEAPRVERLAWTALVVKGQTGSRMANRSLVHQLHAADLTRAGSGAAKTKRP